MGQERRGRPLHDLLIAPLHRAVALVEMHQVAVLVAEDLHLDVARAADQLLEIHLVLAEGGLRLAPRGRHRLDEAAPRSRRSRMPRPPPPQLALSMTRKADRARHREHLGLVRGQRRRRRHHRHAGALAPGCAPRPCCRACAWCRAAGPRKRCPAAAQASANSGLSDKKPYPG